MGSKLPPKTNTSPDQAVAINEALLVSGLRQHELTEAAEKLNDLLRQEIAERKESERRVRVSEMRYRRLFEATQDGILLLNPVSRKITDANPFITTLLGYTRDELVGKELWEIGLLKDEQASHAAFRSLQKSGVIRYDNLPLQARDGRAIEVEFVSNLYQEDGVTVIQCHIRDVTERKQSARFMAEQARLLDLSHDAIIIRDVENKIIYWNHGAEELYGWSREEALGNDLHSFLQTEFEKPLEQLLAELRRKSRLSGEIIQVARDGRRISALCRWVMDYDEHGNPAAILTTTTDITDRKVAEKALAEAAEKLRFMAESMPQKIFTADPTGAVTYFNQQWTDFTGLSFEQIRNWGWTQFVHPDDIEKLMSTWKHSVASGADFQFEYRCRRRDGAYHWHLTRAHAMHDAAGKILIWVGSNTDVDDQKRASDELRIARDKLSDQAGELERLVTERTAELREVVGELEGFSYSVAHDLRAPLRAIEGYSTSLLEDYADKLDQPGRDYLHRMARSATRMDKLIQDVLSYTRVLKADVPMEEIELELLLADVIQAYPGCQVPGASIEIQRPLPKVFANEALLSQCVSNLLGNALKFVSPGTQPRVRIWADRNNNHARLWFEDNGLGILEQDHARIYRMFERIHPDTDFDGTGIGLTIVRKAVERMGGRVGFDSEFGKGSRFWIELKQTNHE